jgi:hypothetical protein
MALHDPHATARYYLPRAASTPRGTEPANALSPLRTRFITAIAGIVFLTGLAIACIASIITDNPAGRAPVVILVICLVLLATAIVDAGYLLRRARRELRQ